MAIGNREAVAHHWQGNISCTGHQMPFLPGGTSPGNEQSAKFTTDPNKVWEFSDGENLAQSRAGTSASGRQRSTCLALTGCLSFILACILLLVLAHAVLGREATLYLCADDMEPAEKQGNRKAAGPKS